MTQSRFKKIDLGGEKTKDILFSILLVTLALFILLQVSPYRQANPGTDSGIFLYIGEQILDGGLPYKDAWDHKGPLIFYINALGLLLAGGSRWGVWLLELITVAAASLLGYKLLKESLGRMPAIFGSLAWLLHLPIVLDGGNLTEEFALLFQFTSLFFFWRSLQSKRLWNELCLGLSVGFTFWLRANIIGIALAIGLFLLWKAIKEKDSYIWKRLGAIIGGILLFSLIIILFFWANGALSGLWDGTFYYNALYSETNIRAQWNSIERGLRMIPVLQMTAISGWIMALSMLWNKHKVTGNYRPLVYVLMLAFPLELLLVSLSGRGFRHYFMSWLPIFAFSSAYMLAFVLHTISDLSKAEKAKRIRMIVSVSLIVGIAWLPILRLLPRSIASIEAFVDAKGIPAVDLSSSAYGPALQYLNDHVGAEEEVIFWGKNLALNWLSGRKVPSRHIFQDHFFTADYVTEDMIEEYVQDISNSKAIIIDTLVGRDSYPPIGTELKKLPKALRPLYDYIDMNYQFRETLRPYGWAVYEYIDGVSE